MKLFTSKTRKKLRVQIVLHYLTASALTLLLMGFILYTSISSVVLDEAVSTTETAVDSSGMYIDLYIDRLKAVTSLLAETPQLVSYLSKTERETLVKEDINTIIDTTILIMNRYTYN